LRILSESIYQLTKIKYLFEVIMKKYKYRAFGLNIVSDFELPELVYGNDGCDVEILHGKIEEADGSFLENKIYKVNSEEIVYQLKDIAACKVQNGNKAIIMPSPNISKSTLRLLILTSVFGCIFIQRKMLPVHGSSVTLGDECIIIAGSSGAGKSTLANAFIENGHYFLADDVAVLNQGENDHIYVQPAYPYRKLHEDSVKCYNYDVEDLERIEYEEDKYLIPLHSHFLNSPKRLKALFEIVPADIENVRIERVKGIEKLKVMMDNLYRGKLQFYFNSKVYYFKNIGEIASKIDIYKIMRPNDKFTYNEQLKLILKQLG